MRTSPLLLYYNRDNEQVWVNAERVCAVTVYGDGATINLVSSDDYHVTASATEVVEDICRVLSYYPPSNTNSKQPEEEGD